MIVILKPSTPMRPLLHRCSRSLAGSVAVPRMLPSATATTSTSLPNHHFGCHRTVTNNSSTIIATPTTTTNGASLLPPSRTVSVMSHSFLRCVMMFRFYHLIGTTIITSTWNDNIPNISNISKGSLCR
jgi:hypothetical protein